MVLAPQIPTLNRTLVFAAILLVTMALLVTVLPSISQEGCVTDDYGICIETTLDCDGADADHELCDMRPNVVNVSDENTSDDTGDTVSIIESETTSDTTGIIESETP